MGKIFFIAILSTLTAFAGTVPNVFGTDQRVAITSTDYPWRTIGFLSNGCTATLVAKDLILTASHCVWDQHGKLLKLTFYPNMINGDSNASATAVWTWWGTKDPDTFRAQDWAIIRISVPLGDQYGWMGVDTLNDDIVNLAGYSGDFRRGQTASVHQGCKIRERTTEGFWLHDCHGNRGSSGGPMWVMKEERPVIVAIEAAERRDGGNVSLYLKEYESAHANIAVPASAFLPKLEELIK